MAKKNFLFAIFTLILTLSLVVVHYKVREFFSPASEYLAQLDDLKVEVERQKLRTNLVLSEMGEYQTQVARMLPEKNQSFQMRNIASISQATLKDIDTSAVMMEKMREDFRKQKYSVVVHTAGLLQNDFPSSPYVVESYFLKGESSYLLGDMATCLNVSKQMMSLFPESELTGYLMLRVSHILKSRDRIAEAGEMLRVVQRSFSQFPDLMKQTSQLAASLDREESHAPNKTR